MGMTRVAGLAIGLLIALGPPSAKADDDATSASIEQVLGDAGAYRDVIARFQAGVKAHDARAVAALVSFPIEVAVGGKARSIRSGADFVAHYDAIMTDRIVAAVADEAYGDMFVNAQGVMLGDGEVWISGVCRDDACAQSDVRVVKIQAGR